jgi:hypothetical protein
MVQERISNRQDTRVNLVNGAWVFAQTLLWPNDNFNEAETELAKVEIEKIILHPSNLVSRDNFIQFCERVLLAYQYLQRKPARYVPHPLKWLSPFYEHGYAGTNDWYLDMMHERQYIVIHRFDIKIIAESFYKYLSAPSKTTFQIGKEAIAKFAETTMLSIFNNLVINYSYGK